MTYNLLGLFRVCAAPKQVIAKLANSGTRVEYYQRIVVTNFYASSVATVFQGRRSRPRYTAVHTPEFDEHLSPHRDESLIINPSLRLMDNTLKVQVILAHETYLSQHGLGQLEISDQGNRWYGRGSKLSQNRKVG